MAVATDRPVPGWGERARSAVQAVFRHNFREQLTGHESTQRTFALDGEGGLLLCTWPHGGRPAIPFIYSDEVWTGIEYQVASHLIFEGRVKEGLDIVRTCRERYDGSVRNPSLGERGAQDFKRNRQTRSYVGKLLQ